MHSEYINQLYSGTRQAVMLLDNTDNRFMYVFILCIVFVFVELSLTVIPGILRNARKNKTSVKEEELIDEEE